MQITKNKIIMKKAFQTTQLTVALFLTLSTTSLNAQNKGVMQDYLLNTKWKMTGLIDKVYEEVYSQEIIEHYYNGDLLGKSYYYLSDTVDTLFDKSKIGKAKQGKYIISKFKDAPEDIFTICLVINADKKELIMRNIKHEHLLRFCAE